ncbi:thymidylate synthase (FAD), partial [Sulfolobus sp. E1]
IRDEYITLEEIFKNYNVEFISQRCIEGVPREGIKKCVINSRTILESIK